MRDVLPQLGEKGRLTVLIDLLLRADQMRLRCYPSVKKIAKDTGQSTSVVDAALDWLVSAKAIIKIGYRQRIGAKEKALPTRQTVYQLTGSLCIDGKAYPYLYFNPETRAVVDELIRLSQSHISENEISQSEILENEISYSETEGITSIKGTTKKKDSVKDAKPLTPFVSMKNAIHKAFGYDEETTTGETWSLIGKAASSLLKAKATPEDMAGLYKYCASRFDNFGAMALANAWTAYAPTRKSSTPAATADNLPPYVPSMDTVSIPAYDDPTWSKRHD